MQMVAIVLLTVIKYYFINFVNFRLWILIPSIKRWSFSSPRWSISWSVTSQKQDLFPFQQHFGGVFFRKQNGFPRRQVRIWTILWPNLITSMYAFSWKSCWRRRNYIRSACAGTSNRYFGNWSFANQTWILSNILPLISGFSFIRMFLLFKRIGWISKRKIRAHPTRFFNLRHGYKVKHDLCLDLPKN